MSRLSFSPPSWGTMGSLLFFSVVSPSPPFKGDRGGLKRYKKTGVSPFSVDPHQSSCYVMSLSFCSFSGC